MRVTFDGPDPVEREYTMTKTQGRSEPTESKALLSADGDFLRSVVRSAVQAALEAALTEPLCGHRFSASAISGFMETVCSSDVLSFA